jgi:hypothetical protein
MKNIKCDKCGIDIIGSNRFYHIDVNSSYNDTFSEALHRVNREFSLASYDICSTCGDRIKELVDMIEFRKSEEKGFRFRT